MNRLFLLVAACGLALGSTVRPATAQTSGEEPDEGTITKVGTTAAQFLKLGVGARAIALGGSFVAEASDLSALYWNPAGLATLGGSAVQFTHTEYLADISYNYAAFGVNLGNLGSLGASLTYLDSGEMDVTTIEQPEGTGERFDVQNLALQLTYGRALTDRFRIGGSLKYVRERLYHSTASAIAFDVGTLFTTPYERLQLGAAISNFGPKLQLDGRDILFSEDPRGVPDVENAKYALNKYAMPLLFRVGLAWEAVETSNYHITATTDAAHPNDNSEYVNVGAEFGFRELLSLRVGHRHLFEEDGEQGWTYGAGLNVRLDRSLRVRLDYAYADFNRLEQTHWFTVDLSF